MAARKETTIRAAYSYNVAFEAARAALAAMGANIQRVDTAGGWLSGTLGITLLSMGEQITVQMRPLSPTETELNVTSESVVGTTVFDWGKNQQNLVHFQGLFAELAAQMTSQAAPPPKPNPWAGWIPDPAAAAPPAEPEPQPTTTRLFLSYRRSDSLDICGRIYDRLVRDLGEENVFKDVDDIPFGVDFVDYLDAQVKRCTAMLVVIGKTWLTCTDDRGRRRLDDPNDFVRLEIESALRQKKLVVPLLVNGAVMPHSDDLPEVLKPLTRRNGIPVRPDPDFHFDMSRLLSRLG